MNILNQRAIKRLDVALDDAAYLQILQADTATGATVVDFGVEAAGGLHAGIGLSEICMAGLGQVSLTSCSLSIATRTAVQVVTDCPALACMASQYAGWPVTRDDYFAMASGPMRLNRGKEPVLEKYFKDYGNRKVIGVLEAEQLPPDQVIEQIARDCQVEPFDVHLCVAPTSSMAGSIQIVARSVEATMHKLFELNFDLEQVRHGWGIAPLPPVSADSLLSIGRTNDAILYGGQVQLWIDADDRLIREVADQLPSRTSADYGRPFLEVFESYNRDFYAIDKMLFSAAEVTLTSIRSGLTCTVGQTDANLLERSFTTTRS